MLLKNKEYVVNLFLMFFYNCYLNIKNKSKKIENLYSSTSNNINNYKKNREWEENENKKNSITIDVNTTFCWIFLCNRCI